MKVLLFAKDENIFFLNHC